MHQYQTGQTGKGRAPKSTTLAADQVRRWGLRMAYLLFLAFCFVFRPRHRGAGVALWHDGRILVIQNGYRSFYGVPAGGIRREESPVAAAARELAEEAGIFIGAGRLRPAGVYEETREFARDRFALFEIVLDQKPVVVIDNREVVWAGFLLPAQALALDLMPPIRTYLETKTGLQEAGGRFRSRAMRSKRATRLAGVSSPLNSR